MAKARPPQIADLIAGFAGFGKLLLLICFICITPRTAWAQVSYAKEDLATVRVLAVQGVEATQVTPSASQGEKAP